MQACRYSHQAGWDVPGCLWWQWWSCRLCTLLPCWGAQQSNPSNCGVQMALSSGAGTHTSLHNQCLDDFCSCAVPFGCTLSPDRQAGLHMVSYSNQGTDRIHDKVQCLPAFLMLHDSSGGLIKIGSLALHAALDKCFYSCPSLTVAERKVPQAWIVAAP